MTKKNILKICISALSLLWFFASISVYAEQGCSEALIRALNEEGFSEEQIEIICLKIRQYNKPEIELDSKAEIQLDSKPEIKMTAIERTAKTIVQALINGNEDLLRELYHRNNRFFLRNLENYYPEFKNTKLDDYDITFDGNTAIITKIGDQTVQYKLHMVDKGNDEYLWEEIRHAQFGESYDKKKKSLADYFFD